MTSDDNTVMIREDHALAMVAAEREACAGLISAGMDDSEWFNPVQAIRSRTPDDAKATLDAMLKAERVRALREAAAVLDRHDSVPCHPAFPESWTDGAVGYYEAGQLDAATSWQNAILALIDKTGE